MRKNEGEKAKLKATKVKLEEALQVEKICNDFSKVGQGVYEGKVFNFTFLEYGGKKI